MISSADLTKQVTNLLGQAGLMPTIISINACTQGGNNRNYKLETPDGIFSVKQYFRQNQDKRDRLATEYAFLSYAKKAAPKSVPSSYAQDPESGLALYEFIEGQSLLGHDVTENELSQAIEFFCKLNSPHLRTQAHALPQASEACFSIQNHLDLIGTRLHALQQIETESDEDKLAHQFIKKLMTQWEQIANRIKEISEIENIDTTAMLTNEERCISPSDFGFHNALKTADGSLRFLDFEYAGWDDPSKMVGDFFSQLAIPVPAHYFERFAEEVMKPFPQAEKLIRRAHLLRPVYQIKWCCIALNIFIPMHLARRKFANPDLNIAELKKNQLTKAEKIMEVVMPACF